MEEKAIECGSDHSMDVILVIRVGFDALRNSHSIIIFSYTNSFLFLLFCLNTFSNCTLYCFCCGIKIGVSK